MIPVLIVRGKAMVLVFRKLLEPEFGRELRVLESDHAGDGVSLARSILLNRKSIVALVADAKPEEVRETHRSIVYLLISVACADLWKITLMVPQMEVLLFLDRGVLRQVLGREPTEEELTRGRTEPRRVLEEQLGLQKWELDEELCRRLETVDVSSLAEHPAVQQVRQFFRDHREGRSSLSL
ncbi:hypothetical protein [Vitiosangium sp. GDMCC 1.1324]|uniref:hypothetical protein n=1 Tax=Vitiosangium sp. (strain GDMCC 1.1324) TaxID=2138576 RepID=UPI000D34261F|nr:hypothetical protein [Vitiosangium sp. GDMCC 1.1324]PTL79946.1 hypothetical protein DAT35_31480 [Vitiosangium sp. GDMCC 1.1324]